MRTEPAASQAHAERMTLAGFALAIIGVLALGWAAWWTSWQHIQAADWVSRTQEAIASIATARAALIDVQNGQRGFVISGRDADLGPYEHGLATLGSEISHLRALTRDNASQQARLAELDAALAPRLASSRDIIAARRAGGIEAAKAIIDTDIPLHQMERVRGIFDDLEGAERNLLDTRIRANAARLDALAWVLGALLTALLALLGVLYWQLRRWQASQARLLRSEQRFHLMTQGVVDYAILMLDTGGHVVSWNLGAERIKGYREDEIVGRHFSLFYTDEDLAHAKPAHALQVAATTSHYLEEGWRVRKDGSRFWASVTITALREPDGTLSGFSKMTRDLSERKRADEALHSEMEETRRMEQALQDLNRSLESLVERRTAALQIVNADLSEAKVRLQDLSSRLMAAQEEERRRISHELHDETGQALTAIKMHLMAMQRAGAHAPAVEECISIVDQTIRQIRNLALELRPLALDDLGLADALESSLERQAKIAGWTTSMEADELPARLPPQIETACFRIGQEALTNIARHAAAHTVRIELHSDDDELVLDIQDDGTGFDYEASRSPAMRRNHFGLVSMTERANLAGGNFELFTAKGKGTRIRVTFPLATWPELL